MNALLKIAIVFAAVPVVIAGCGNSSSGSGAPVNTSSKSYRMGLDSGSTGRAEVEAFGGWGASGPTPYEQACQLGWKLDSGDGYDKSMSKQDYMAGCIYGLNHQDAEWTRGRERPR